MYFSPLSFCRSCACLLAVVVAVGTSEAWATHPRANCDQPEILLDLLSGKPHYEQQALLMMDEAPDQGHRFEFFMNSGEGGRHSYTLLRIRHGSNLACIMSAGIIVGKSQDNQGRSHLTLNDENDQDVYDIVSCHGRYVITRAFVGEDACAQMELLYGTSNFIVSYGRIVTDRRTSIPWPGN